MPVLAYQQNVIDIVVSDEASLPAPGSVPVGTLAYAVTEKTLWFLAFDSNSRVHKWELAQGGGVSEQGFPLTSDVSAAGFRIKDLPRPTDTGDAVNKGYVDSMPVQAAAVLGPETALWSNITSFAVNPTNLLNGTEDALGPFLAMCEDAYAKGLDGHMPPGMYNFSGTVTMPRPVKVRGSGFFRTTCRFPGGTQMFVIDDNSVGATLENLYLLCAGHIEPWKAGHSYAVGDLVVPTEGINADARIEAWLADLYLIVPDPREWGGYVFQCSSAGTSNPLLEPDWSPHELLNQEGVPFADASVTWTPVRPDAIRLLRAGTLRDLLVDNLDGNAITLISTGSTSTNANESIIERVKSRSCFGHGIFTTGNDANACTFYRFEAEDMQGVGMFENSFIGNNYEECRAEGCLNNGYVALNRAARAIFSDCYGEQNSPIWVVAPNKFSNGTPGKIIAGSCYEVGSTLSPRLITSDDGSQLVIGASAGIESWQGSGETNRLLIRFISAGQFQGWYAWSQAGLDNNTRWLIAGDHAPVPPGYGWASDGHYVGLGDAGHGTPARKTYARGDSTSYTVSGSVPWTIAGVGEKFYFYAVTLTGGSGDFTLTIADTDTDPRWFFNATGGTATVSRAGGGASKTIAPGMACVVANDGTNILRMTAEIDPRV